MTEWAKGKAYKAAGGCNEDCFNCPFPDCYKAARSLKLDEAAKEALRVVGDTSQSRIYTLELGGVGRNMPNISKKYYL
ncbi:MAG: hypothetical protein U0L66_07830 [Acutalibacteraceae bacterium]|nr:hypothetical protein [Acutalibacteraceae bacterium]